MKKALAGFENVRGMILSSIRSLRPESVPDTASLDFYLPLVEKLNEQRLESGNGLIVSFTSVAPGHGVTYVIESMAWELARYSNTRVLLSSSSNLGAAVASTYDDDDDMIPGWCIQRQPDVAASELALPRNPAWEDLQRLRERYGFVLVDCPSMRTSSAVLNLARATDGVILVVAAGATRRDEVERGQRVLLASSAKLLGMVLNKRSDPLPDFLSRIL